MDVPCPCAISHCNRRNSSHSSSRSFACAASVRMVPTSADSAASVAQLALNSSRRSCALSAVSSTAWKLRLGFERAPGGVVQGALKVEPPRIRLVALSFRTDRAGLLSGSLAVARRPRGPERASQLLARWPPHQSRPAPTLTPTPTPTLRRPGSCIFWSQAALSKHFPQTARPAGRQLEAGDVLGELDAVRRVADRERGRPLQQRIHQRLLPFLLQPLQLEDRHVAVHLCGSTCSVVVHLYGSACSCC